MNFEEILRAKENISEDIFSTPLLRAPAFENNSVQVLLKCENFQRTRSFKIRGAMNRLRELGKEAIERGVVTRSSGNFAQALACSAEHLGVHSTIVVPETISATKKSRTLQYHPELIVHGKDSNEADAKADEIAMSRDCIRISPYNDTEVIAGQGTAGLEVAQELTALDYFFCPIGGGGLLSGCALAIKHLHPNCYIVGVEPEGANDYFLSRKHERKVTLEHVDTIADGLRTPTVGSNTYPLLNRYVDHAVTVTDQQITESQHQLNATLGIAVEPSAATSLAAIKLFNFAAPRKAQPLQVVALLSGGNV